MLSYIKKAPNKGLVYRKNSHLRIETYSNSGYAKYRRDKSLLPDIIPMLEEILLHSVVKSKTLSPNQVLNPNIDP